MPGWLAWLAALYAGSICQGETLIFFAQNSNYSWFSSGNWFTNDPANNNALGAANTIPGPGDVAVINGAATATATSINIEILDLNPGAGVNFGNFTVAQVAMNPGSAFSGSILNVGTQMAVSGGCTLSAATLTIKSGASLLLSPGASLACATSTIFNVGEITLPAGSSLSSGTNLVNFPNATIDASTNATLSGTGTFDNQGTVQSDTGNFNVGPFNLWTSSTGTGRFSTTSSNALITFPNALTILTNVTYIFTGPGTTRWPAGANLVGTAQVGLIVTNSGVLDPGTVEADGFLSSNGVIHVVATPQASSALNCVTAPTLNGPTLNLDTNAQLNILGGLDAQNSIVNNSGIVTWKKGDVYLPGSVFNNLTSGLFDCQVTNTSTDGAVGSFGYAGGVFNNWGAFRKSQGSHGIVFDGEGPAFNNAGLVDVRSGYIEFAAGTNSGTFNMAPGAEIWFGGSVGATNFLLPGVQFTGTNLVRVVSFVDLYLAADVSFANLSLQDSGVIDGPADFTVTNTFLWTGGTVQGGGALNIPPGAIFSVQGGPPAFDHRTLNNRGTILPNNSGFNLGAGAVINNMPSGLINCASNSGIGADDNPPTSALNNYGTIMRSAGQGEIALYMNFTNYGQVLFQTGSVELYNFQQLSGSTVLASNASLLVGAPMPLTLLGGTFSGLGSVNGPISNSAVVIPESPPGTLTIGQYAQSPSGNLDILIDGAAAGQYRQINTSGSPILAGALNVSIANYFGPSVGQKFVVVSANYPIMGTFSSYTGLHTSNYVEQTDIVLVPSYSVYDVTLTAANDPIINTTAHTGHQTTFSYSSTAGFTNLVQYTDSLTPPLWKTLTNISGDGTLKTVIDPTATNAMRFYRIAF
jgi:hypothetical protein